MYSLEKRRDGRGKVAVLDPLAKKQSKARQHHRRLPRKRSCVFVRDRCAGHGCGEAGDLRLWVAREADEPPPTSIRLDGLWYGHVVRGGIRFNLGAKRLSIAMRTSSRS